MNHKVCEQEGLKKDNIKLNYVKVPWMIKDSKNNCYFHIFPGMNKFLLLPSNHKNNEINLIAYEIAKIVRKENLIKKNNNKEGLTTIFYIDDKDQLFLLIKSNYIDFFTVEILFEVIKEDKEEYIRETIKIDREKIKRINSCEVDDNIEIKTVKRLC